LKLPNLFETEIKREKWKQLVKEAILKVNEKELKEEILKSKRTE